MDMRVESASDTPPCTSPGIGPDEAHWRELAASASGTNPFYHPALLVPALRFLDRAGTVRLLEAWDDDRLIGLLPVVPLGHHERYPVRNVANWMHDQCFYGAPLLRRGAEVAAWARILAQLDEARWAGNFLHLEYMDRDGPAATALHACCARERRSIATIATHQRALLQSDLTAEAYWEANVRSKKRKEIRRLLKRLEELGSVTHSRLRDGGSLSEWIEAFLALERSGWKGKKGTALDSSDRTRGYFREALVNARDAGMLDMLRIDVDGRPIAMLVNLYAGRGAYSYKIAYDENFARFSPGILIEIDNLHGALADPDLEWMDSCAAANHSMIDGIWAQRRCIEQYRVALRGGGPRQFKRTGVFHGTTLAERAIKALRGKRG